MSDVEFSYDAQVSQTGLLTIKIPSHFLAVLVAEKLGLPIPNRNAQCEVNPISDETSKEGDHMVNIDFEYLARVSSAPVTLNIPRTTPADVDTPKT